MLRPTHDHSQAAESRPSLTHYQAAQSRPRPAHSSPTHSQSKSHAHSSPTHSQGAENKPIQKPTADSTAISINVVVVGRSGAGKSTLLKNVTGLDIDTDAVSPIERRIADYELENNGVTINFTDTVGFIGSRCKSEMKQLHKKLSKHVKGEVDLIIYCLSVGPGSRFSDANPSIMRSLQDAFGKDIWKHCMVALTFSNLAWDRIRRGNKDEESEYEEYKKLLKEYVDLFQRELKTLKVCDVEVRSIFDAPADKSDKQTIMCVPAGDDPDDQVLADSRYTLEASGEPLELTKWSDILVAETLKRLKKEPCLATQGFWQGLKRLFQGWCCCRSYIWQGS